MAFDSGAAYRSAKERRSLIHQAASPEAVLDQSQRTGFYAGMPITVESDVSSGAKLDTLGIK